MTSQANPAPQRRGTIPSPRFVHTNNFAKEKLMSSTTQAPPAHGTFCWNELMTRDAKAAINFYTTLFGWSTHEMDMGPNGTYTILMPKGSENGLGGVMEMSGECFEGVPPHWMSYVAVDDIEASTKQAEQLGGKVIMPVTPIPNVGKFSIIEDPTGAKLAMYKGGAS